MWDADAFSADDFIGKISNFNALLHSLILSIYEIRDYACLKSFQTPGTNNVAIVRRCCVDILRTPGANNVAIVQRKLNQSHLLSSTNTSNGSLLTKVSSSS